MTSTRRQFIATASGVIAATAALSSGVAHAANKKLKVGLIGCGGRGTGAATQALMADPDTELVALGDLFQDQIDTFLQKLTTGPAKERVNVTKRSEERRVGKECRL